MKLTDVLMRLLTTEEDEPVDDRTPPPTERTQRPADDVHDDLVSRLNEHVRAGDTDEPELPGTEHVAENEGAAAAPAESILTPFVPDAGTAPVDVAEPRSGDEFSATHYAPADDEEPLWPAAWEQPPLPEPAFTAAELEQVGEPYEARRPGTALALSDRDFSHLELAAGLAESHNLGYHLASAVDRIAAAAQAGSDGVPLLLDAVWLIERYVELIQRRPVGADIHLSSVRLARAGHAIAGIQALAETLDVEVEQPTSRIRPDRP